MLVSHVYTACISLDDVNEEDRATETVGRLD